MRPGSMPTEADNDTPDPLAEIVKVQVPLWVSSGPPEIMIYAEGRTRIALVEELPAFAWKELRGCRKGYFLAHWDADTSAWTLTEPADDQAW